MLLKYKIHLVLVQVQVQVLVLDMDLSGPTSLWFGLGTFFTRLGPCVALALLFLFISVNHTSHQP